MDSQIDYILKNKNTWNMKTEHHVESDFYDVENFMKGKSSLNDIELDLLGDVSGKSILHLQCHFGQDTLSLERTGAIVTGVDLSDKAIEQANVLTKKLNSKATFICCDVYDLPKHLDKKFDIVYTSYGTIGWLPDIDKWANIISTFLKPQGKFIFADFHPVVWMFDNDFKEIYYNYFKSEPIVEIENGTYANTNAPIQTESITWNHSISEVLTALLNKGIELQAFREFNYSPYNCFNNMEEFEPKKYRIKSLGNKIPMVYAIVASKK